MNDRNWFISQRRGPQASKALKCLTWSRISGAALGTNRSANLPLRPLNTPVRPPMVRSTRYQRLYDAAHPPALRPTHFEGEKHLPSSPERATADRAKVLVLSVSTCRSTVINAPRIGNAPWTQKHL